MQLVNEMKDKALAELSLVTIKKSVEEFESKIPGKKGELTGMMKL